MRERPAVEYLVPCAEEAVFAAFRVALEDPVSACVGFVGRTDLTLHVRESTRRWWSPWLQLRVTSHGDCTRLSGRMGPHPNLWTGFVFVYSALVAVFVAGSMLGFVQFTLSQAPSGLWAVGVSLVGLAGSCSVDLFGRRLGTRQMGSIRAFVEDTLARAEAGEVCDSTQDGG